MGEKKPRQARVFVRSQSLFAFLDVKDKYNTNNIDFKCFYNSLNKNGYNLVYNIIMHSDASL